jgi:hypothetical protein
VSSDDQSWLKSLISKRILVGLTWVDEAGATCSQEQFHGIITSATPRGVVVRRSDGRRDFTLPSRPEFIKVAEPGHYRLRTSGEVVENPDLLCAMNMVAQPSTPEQSTNNS